MLRRLRWRQSCRGFSEWSPILELRPSHGGCPDQRRPPSRHPPSIKGMDAAPGDRPTTNAKGERPNHEQAYYTMSSDGRNRRPQPCPIARDRDVRRGYCGASSEPAGQRTQPLHTLLSTMKDGRRLGQSGRYARLAPAEYIVSADSSCLTPQRGCAERYQPNSSTSPRS